MEVYRESPSGPTPLDSMNVEPMAELSIESGANKAEPLYFTSGTHTLFGWLHSPHGVPSSNMGLVICNAFGYEAICAHRSIRAFAQNVASAGVPVLRFDYSGTGDSEDIDPNSDQLEAWTRNVIDAVAALRRHTGIEQVGLLGFRLGAMVAALAAAQGADATALIAVAPVISGRRYLRELRTIRMAAPVDAPPKKTDGPESFEVSGFSLSAATVAALSNIELVNLALPSVTDLLVIDRKELPGAKPWADALMRSGLKTEYVALPGFVRMMMTAPHFSLIPQAMIAATRDWLSRLVRDKSRPMETLGQESSARREYPPTNVLHLAYDAADPGSTLTETAVFLSSEPRVFAIATEPRRGEARRRGVILLNAGATHHVGPNRMYVDLARRWAARGYVVFRMDLAGLGDSGIRLGRPDNEVHPPAALEDVRAAVDFMRSRYGINNITLGGMCSGAFHSLRSAVAALPVRRILMVNPLNYYWHEGMSLHDLTWLGFVHSPRTYLEQVLPAKFWRKVLTGQVDLRRLLKLYVQHLYVLFVSALHNAARALHIPVSGDLGYEMQAVAARGTEMVFVFAQGEPGVRVLTHQGGSSVKRLGTRCRIHSIDGANHL